MGLRTMGLRALGLRALGLLLLVALPFWVLVRGGIWLDVSHGWPPWLACLAAAGATTALLTGYASWVGVRVADRFRVRGRVWRAAAAGSAASVVLFSGHSLIVLSELHAKGASELSEYGRLHPSLRLAIGSYRLVDDQVLVTDVARDRAEYTSLGLQAPRRSRHAEQQDGFVHAMDLRTIGRSGIRNALLKMYFAGMGFDTLRHVGTADHLHVSLPSRGRASS
jgi:hypothetical protein